MSTVARSTEQRPLYEADYYAWALEQGRALRDRRFEALDLAHLPEEVEDLAKSERRQLLSRLARILAHILKFQCHPSRRSPGWQHTLDEQRLRIGYLFDESPSLRRELPELFERAYKIAASQAGKEMRMDRDQWRRRLPQRCPWTVDQVLDEEFYPQPHESRR